MSQQADIERYVNDPSLLLDLCKQAAEQLVSNDKYEKMAAMSTQLREVSKAIDNLEKMRIEVPDVLRAEKTRLASALSGLQKKHDALCHFRDGIESILAKIRTHITSSQKSGNPRRRRRPRVTATPEQIEQIRSLRASGRSWREIDGEIWGITDSHGGRSWNLLKRLENS